MTMNIATQRIALNLEYDGTGYHGWQSQNIELATVQSTVATAIAKVADHPVQIFCAGRTDVGVHAMGQVIHFDTNKKRSQQAWLMGTNSYLPRDIRIQWTQEVPAAFHARFSAISRHYRYVIHNSQQVSALLRNKVLWYPWRLNEQTMQQAINYLLGEHDFSAFRASSCQSVSPKRHLQLAKVVRQNDYIIIDVKANAFLHHMVRNIVGTLLPIGRGEKTPQWLAGLLNGRDRRRGGITAPAMGLYLVAVEYPTIYALPPPIKTPYLLF